MKRENVIPITKQGMLNKDIYYILELFNANIEYVDYDAARENTLIFKFKQPFSRGNLTNANGYNKRNLLNELEMPLNSDFICLMPRKTLDILFEVIQPFSVTLRKRMVRVFMYIYYYSMGTTNGGYSHSRADIAAELHLNQAQGSETSQSLEKCGLIQRGSYLKGLETRRYYIPDYLGTDECVNFNTKKI